MVRMVRSCDLESLVAVSLSEPRSSCLEEAPASASGVVAAWRAPCRGSVRTRSRGFMRIAYLSRSTLPSRDANAVHVVSMCDALAGEGHDVYLFGYAGEGHGPGELDAWFGRIAVGVGFRLTRSSRSAGRLRALHHTLRSAIGVRRLLPQWVYARDAYSLALVRLLLPGRPFVYEMHGLAGGMRRRLDRRLIEDRNCAVVVVISQVLKDDLMREVDVPADRVLVLHDAARASQEQRTDAPCRARPRVAYVGSLYPGKGVEIVREAAVAVPEADFVVAGGQTEDLRRWRATTTPPNLSFLGHMPHARVSSLLADCDIALLPQQEHVALRGGRGDIGRWTSPLKLFEYMASGAGIVASDRPTIREVLDDGVDALLVPPSDTEAWVTAIRVLVGDPDLRRSMGARARQKLEERYTWQARASTLLESLPWR